MVAVVVSAAFIVFLLIPEGIFRLIFGLFISPQSFVLTRTEKAYRAVLITILPFVLAWTFSWYVPAVRTYPFPIRANSVQQRRQDYKTVAEGLYSDTDFAKLGDNFWHATTRCARRQSRLIFWYFLFVVGESVLVGALVARYPKLKGKRTKWIGDKFLTAYISQWHPLLRPKDKTTIVQVDLLCDNDTLYQGEMIDYFLRDGELSGILLKNPRRFDRVPYIKAKENGEKPDPNEYWRSIPSISLYFLADKILNVNINYTTTSKMVRDIEAAQKFVRKALPPDVGKVTLSVEKGPEQKIGAGSENHVSKPPVTG